MPEPTGRAAGGIHGIGALLFAAFAAVQYNDPDPLGWAALYAGAAGACWLGWRHRSHWGLAAVVASVAVVWAVILAPSALPFRPWDLAQSMRAETPAIELGREFSGLLVVAVWMALLVRSAWQRRLLD